MDILYWLPGKTAKRISVFAFRKNNQYSCIGFQEKQRNDDGLLNSLETERASCLMQLGHKALAKIYNIVPASFQIFIPLTLALLVLSLDESRFSYCRGLQKFRAGVRGTECESEQLQNLKLNGASSDLAMPSASTVPTDESS